MSFHVLSTLLSASAERFPDTHVILVAESLGLCDPSRTLNQLRKLPLADYVYIYPTKDLFTDLDVLPQGTLITLTLAHGLTADTLIAPGSVDDPATHLQIYYASNCTRPHLSCSAPLVGYARRKVCGHRQIQQTSQAFIFIFTSPGSSTCNELCPVRDKKTLSFEDFDLDLLRRPDHIVSQALIQERNLGSTLDTPRHLCPWKIPHSAEPVIAVCRRCCTDHKANKVPPLSTANNNYLGPAPPELKDLTIVEEAMISLCRAKCWILRSSMSSVHRKPKYWATCFAGRESLLLIFLGADCGRKPGIILTERTWAHNNTVMVNTSDETRNGEDDDRDVRGPMLGARISDLMRCAVVMQVKDRSRSEIEGCDVYDWVRGP
ncbi:hypothetical protein B0H13DRAFT_1874896 [Mycena leptocephala]|nr:hypothetical protein B0H13DRAFT_1874896 [Mycena leptocephala]